MLRARLLTIAVAVAALAASAWPAMRLGAEFMPSLDEGMNIRDIYVGNQIDAARVAPGLDERSELGVGDGSTRDALGPLSFSLS